MPLLIAGLAYYRYDDLDPETRISATRQLLPEYDFIVIGGGSAGAVVASRLSEISHWRILLLEAGPQENEISEVPSLAAYLQLSNIDWQYKTEPTGYFTHSIFLAFYLLFTKFKKKKAILFTKIKN